MSWHPDHTSTGRPVPPPPPPHPAPGPVDQPWQPMPSPIPNYTPPQQAQYGGYRSPQDYVPTPPRAPQPRYADWGERAAATLIDGAILFVVTAVLGMFSNSSEVLSDIASVILLAILCYFAWLNGSKGQTPGKALTGIKLVRDEDGTTLGGPVGFVRGVVLFFLSGLTGGIFYVVSVLWPFRDPKQRTLHDKVVGASAVSGLPRARFGKQIFLP